MQEYINMEAARKELLSSFEMTHEIGDWSKFEYHDVPWTMWKDGSYIKLFYEAQNTTYGFKSYSYINRNECATIKDNEEFVLFIGTWSENYISHSRYIIIPKRKMIDSFPDMKVFLWQGKTPFQITFERGVKNSCSLNHS